MKVYVGEGLGTIYCDLVQDISEWGRKVETRGKTCLEMPEPVTLVYTSPGKCWMNIPGRKFNPFFALAEVVWILSGRGDVKFISYFNKRMKDFQDGDWPLFHGAYGLRIREWNYQYSLDAQIDKVDQIREVIKKLRANPASRQAVISIWDPARDNQYSKDIPCNSVVYYSLRDGVLDQTVVIRSNDLIWGTPYNAIQFTHLHALVAGCLKAKMGTFTYVIQNLHYYLGLYDNTLDIVRARAREGNLRAESIQGFRTLDWEQLDRTTVEVERMFESRGTLHKPFVGDEMTFNRVGYWDRTVPLMIWLFIVIKEQLPISESFLAEMVFSLPEPLPSLIVDFYKDSKNEVAQAVLTHLSVLPYE